MSLRLTAALAAIPFLCAAAHAGVAEDLTAAINKCAAIADDGMRHACYDRLPALAKSLAPVAATEAAQARAATEPPGEKGSSGGLFDLFDGEPLPADRIKALVESFTYEYGLFVVTLDDGQVWRQTTSTHDLVRLSKDKKTPVTIWRNRFGEYVLNVDGTHTVYRVRRIK